MQEDSTTISTIMITNKKLMKLSAPSQVTTRNAKASTPTHSLYQAHAVEVY
jgi:hypothetical protein